MKTINVREFKDLTPAQQEKAREACINSNVEFYLECLGNELEREEITEEEYWEEIGCSKHYGESTPWFVGAVYYQYHQQEVDNSADSDLKEAVFNKYGTRLLV